MPSNAIMVSLDGGITYQEATEDIRIIVGGMLAEDPSSGEEVDAELHLCITGEGLITDLVDPESTGECLATSSEMFDEIVTRLV